MPGENIKDRFSEQANEYAVYRPGYPDALYEFILSLIPDRKCALDVATGNGQVAAELSKHFEKVFAIDISEQQLQHTIKKDTIHYSMARAENTGLKAHQFDLITAGQAAHWFNLPEFYSEAKRILKPKGVLALFGYQLMAIDPETDAVIMDFYNRLLGPFWDPERKFVDEGYESLSFPFNKIDHPPFKMEYSWTYDQLKGFLGTWSAVQHYKRKHGQNPLDIIDDNLKKAWGDETYKKITFPVFLLVARLLKL